MFITRRSGVLNVAVLGFGGRIQALLVECVKLEKETQKKIRVVAICDDCARESLRFFVNLLNKRRDPLVGDYEKIFAQTSFYLDNEQGLQQLFSNHKKLDRVLIASANYRHFTHLNSALNHECKNLFIEKPIFRSLDEYHLFQADTRQATIHVGLCLCYATMTKIAEAKLREYREQLGPLKKVVAWEHVNFGHALSIIMMNWRRSLKLSGGLFNEKVIHDLHLALFFMQAVGAIPRSLGISTKASHEFFKKSRQEEILSRLTEDDLLRERTEGWDTSSWQRKIPFSRLESGAIDWAATMEAFFQEFPKNDDFTNSDIIPDRHTMTAKIETTNGNPVDFEVEVKLNDFAQTTERGMIFTFERGVAEIDIARGMMAIEIGSFHQGWELGTDNQSHAGGDVYVAHALLGTLPKDRHKATFNDSAVQLATLMGLVSEKQAISNQTQEIHLTQANNRWVIEE